MNVDPHLIALSLIPNLGHRTITHLLDHFGTPDAIFAANIKDLLAIPRIGPKRAAAIHAVDLAQIRQEIAAWQADGIEILRYGSPPYPETLAALPDAPLILFQRGTITPADQRAAAVIGTRQPTAAARTLAMRLGETLAAHGWTVVSGLAVGIDTAGHWGALHAGGRTLAVLGSGVRTIYPPENVSLAAQIVTRGALLSETHPDASPSGPALVARNRLITGLSRVVIVIEAGENSGALHAARFAQEQGRSIFAVNNGAAGNAQLLANGAHALSTDLENWENLYDFLAHQS